MGYYKLLIVEDEDTIRRGLVREVPWQAYGFEVAAEAANGRAALLRIDEARPDAVLTDVKMPVMNGIDLMAAIRERHPGVKVVILSGYGEFEYAQKGIEYGAFAYLLKPTKEEQVRDVFLRLKAELDGLSGARSLADSRLRGLKEKYFEDLLAGTEDREAAERMAAGLGDAGVPAGGAFTVLTVRPAPGHEGLAAAERGMREALARLGGCVLMHLRADAEGRRVTAVAAGECGSALADALREAVPGMLGAGVSRTRAGVASLARSREEAARALEAAFYLGRGAVALASEREDAPQEAETRAERQLLERLVERVQQGDEEGAEELAGRYAGLLRVLRGPPAQLMKRFTVLSATAEARSPERFRDDPMQRQQWLDRFGACLESGTIEDAEALIRRYAAGAARACGGGKDRLPPGMAGALELVRANYGRKLTLEEAAAAAYMNPSYFSRQFKLATGKSFIDYLTELRMERAKELLHDRNARVYEVAAQVGYDDYRHFCKVFRRHAGMSPLQYRNARPGPGGR